MKRNSLFLCFIILFFLSNISYSNVIIILADTQQQKKESRWTISDWFSQKEEMRKMDEWLKLNTNPDNSDFRLELGLTYKNLMLDEKFIFLSDQIEFKNNDIENSYFELGGKIYLNDLVSATLGIPTLNIDIGLSGFYSKTRVKKYAYGGLLRFFGNDLQHTMLDVGFYLNHEDILIPPEINPIGASELKGEIKNWLFRATLQIYLLDFFGLEGSYNHFTKANSTSSPKIEMESSGYDYSLFLELWALRLSGGFTHESKKYNINENSITHEIDGMYFTAELYF
jgi:hypothetical protein